MTTADLRRLWRRKLSTAAIEASEREERTALGVLALLVQRGVIPA